MLKSNNVLSFSSQTSHPYLTWIEQSQEKIFLAITVGLLKRLAQDTEEIVAKKLQQSNRVWNRIKELNGFKNNEKELTQSLVDSTRKLLLLRQLILHFSEISICFVDSDLIKEALNIVPDNTILVFLEELLDDFMKNEQTENQTLAEVVSNNLNVTKDTDFSPDKVDEEIQSIQVKKQNDNSINFTHNQYNSSEGQKTIDSELKEYLHSTLHDLHVQSKHSSINFIQDYINQLENHDEIKLYINRPAYKLALRIRNNLIFSYSSENQSFSKEGISQVIKIFKSNLIKSLERYLFVTCIHDIQYSYIQEVVYKITCKIYNKITRNPNFRLTTSLDVDDYIEFIAKNPDLLDDYHEIPLKEHSVLIEDSCSKIYKIFKNYSSHISLRNDLSYIFFDMSKQIAEIEKVALREDDFENHFFDNNSSNILLEFSRHYLSKTDFTFEEFNEVIKGILSKQEYNIEICSCLQDSLSMNYSWSVYFPVTGIHVDSQCPQSLFHELVSSLSEIHEIKFLSPEILKSVSIEATSLLEGGGIIFEFNKASACAFFKGIKAGDSIQALKIAINQLSNAIEIQWYLTSYGYQHKIEPLLAENSQIIAFCKQEFRDISSEPKWKICSLSLKRGGTFDFNFSDTARKYIAIPARHTKILYQRAEIDNSLGKLALNILDSIKLFRQGYFSSQLSDRFRLYWTVLDILFSPEASSSQTTKSLIPYRVSLFCLGIMNLMNTGDTYKYKQARMWMREDIEDLYTFIRNPLIHNGVENTPACERLMDRFEDIVSAILNKLSIIVIYQTLPDSYLEKGMEGIIQFMETQTPSSALIPTVP